jgi:superfamily II DNA or RNA helicase
MYAYTLLLTVKYCKHTNTLLKNFVMKKIFKQLEVLIKKSNSIIDVADEVEKLRKQLKKEEDLVLFVNTVRETVQFEAFNAVVDNNGRGLVAMATGAGKSKVGVMLAKYYQPRELGINLGLVVPTEKLRDENWKEEFTKWNAKPLWRQTLRLCYASASKIDTYTISMLILDEGHNITALSSEIFKNNYVKNVVLLTATPPTSVDKLEILKELNISLVYHLTLDVAVKLGFVAPYKITVVYTELDAVEKYVVAGNKLRPFYQTEKASYDYLTLVIDTFKEKLSPTFQERERNKFAILKRMHSIYSYKSKTLAAKFILDNLIPKDDRTLIFCGGIPQAEALSDHFYHSKTNSKSYDLFKSEEVNRLSCVKAINEGHNFPGIDSGVIVQINSKEKDLIQRLGRLLRFRPGHEGHLYIVVIKGTQDEVWLNNALLNFDSTRIEYTDFKTLKDNQ